MLASYISQLMSSIQNELSIADRQATIAQLKAWEKFSLHHDFPGVDISVYDEWVPDRFLDWKEVSIKLCVKPKFSILNLLKNIFNPSSTSRRKKYKLVSENNPKALKVNITFTKTPNSITGNFTILS